MEQREYVRRLLDTYRTTPGTTGMVRHADRFFAAQLHEREVPLEVALPHDWNWEPGGSSRN